jgi:hypothetical protein
LPVGWYKSGTALDSYKISLEKKLGHDGKNAISIKSSSPAIKGFASLMQSALPDKFLVRRVRMSAWMKTQNCNDWAGFFLRADQEGNEQALSFDNMMDRGVKGTTDWKKYEIVVDIPAKTTVISYGGMISGTGQIWFNDFKFEIVDNNISTTGKGNAYPLPQHEPNNLDFEK